MDAAAAGKPWTRCPGLAGYPVIELDFLDADEASPHSGFREFLFDTGAGSCWLSMNFLIEAGIDLPADAIFRPMRRKLTADKVTRFRAVDFETRVSLRAGHKSTSGRGTFRVVDRWDESGLEYICSFGECSRSDPISHEKWRCGTRSGLVSSKLLKDLKARVILDGRDGSTHLVTSE